MKELDKLILKYHASQVIKRINDDHELNGTQVIPISDVVDKHIIELENELNGGNKNEK